MLLRIGSAVGLPLAMLAGYSLLPLPEAGDARTVYFVLSGVGLAVYAWLIVWGLGHLRSTRYPVVDGIILTICLASLIILGFAWTYQVVMAQDPAAFSESMNKYSAVYFTVTVLTTVGFGDITPVSDAARMVVTAQMLLGISLISLTLKIVLQAAKDARQAKDASSRRPG